MSKHTPGPWSIDWGNPIHIDGVAIVPQQLDGTHTANARLIAAAPELLKELQSILEDIDSDHGNDHDYSKTRTLISRVTGDES
jgi:hypothetical protein